MGVNTGAGLDQGHSILSDWDGIGSRELQKKPQYLYAISVVLAEFFRGPGNAYDYRLIYDLLSGERTQSYTGIVLDSFLCDLQKFTEYWGKTQTYYADENISLVQKFDEELPMLSDQEYFRRLKSHRLKKRIHKPVLAVLKIRAKAWQKESSSTATQELFDELS